MIQVIGSAGFIGSNFVLVWLAERDEPIVSFDALTYAGNIGDEHLIFIRGNIEDAAHLTKRFEYHRPRAVGHFSAEAHVDRSMQGQKSFFQTNIVWTFQT